MARPRPVIASLAAVALTTALCAGCSDDDNGSGNGTPEPRTATAAASMSAFPVPGASGATVGTAKVGKLGTILIDARGRTLYVFEQDTSAASTCYDACAATWPPALVTGTPVAGEGVDAAKLTTMIRNDGATQLVYDEHPLYTYAGDIAPDQANGQDSTAFGAKWFVIDADGDKVDGD